MKEKKVTVTFAFDHDDLELIAYSIGLPEGQLPTDSQLRAFVRFARDEKMDTWKVQRDEDTQS